MIMRIHNGKLWQVLFTALVIVTAASCDNDDDDNKGPEGKNKMFIQDVAYGNNAEINFGQLAQTKGSLQAVKMFGQLMVQDHQKVQNDLDTIASKRNFGLPSDLKQDHMKMRDTISGYAGLSFDSAYITGQIRMHTKTREMLEAFLDTSSDQGLKNFANRTLPAVILHLHKADSIAQILGH
jgi:putative membrane protein